MRKERLEKAKEKSRNGKENKFLIVRSPKTMNQAKVEKNNTIFHTITYLFLHSKHSFSLVPGE